MFNIALNGIGRVGRSLLRRSLLRSEFNIIAVNDLVSDVENIAYGLNYDSIYGPLTEKFVARDTHITRSNQRIRVLNEPDISKVNWRALGADILIDSSGVHTNVPLLKSMVESSVISWGFVTHLAQEADVTLTLGCNEGEFRHTSHRVISCNTCDGTAIGPVLMALDKTFGIDSVSLAVIHPWLNHQNLLDAYTPDSCGKNYELGRASSSNVIAKKTSVEAAIRKVLPQLNDKYISAVSYRIPTPVVACADLSMRFNQTVEKEEILAALEAAQRENQWNLISLNREPLVSSDFIGCDFSAVIEERLLSGDGRRARLTLWYDNESGYASRVLDQVRYCVTNQ